MQEDIKNNQKNDKNSENEVSEEERFDLVDDEALKASKEANKETFAEYKEAFINNLGAFIAIILGIALFIIALFKAKGAIALPITIIGLGFGSIELRNFITTKKAIFCIAMIICYLLAIVGFVGFILA
jgi:ABC-type multidrug transport system fused ATPase/permease subunit